MAPEVFVDSSGWYALLDRRDSHHAQARRAVARSAHAHGVLVTTDYIIDETAMLTKSRAGAHACSRFFDLIEQTRALRIDRCAFRGKPASWRCSIGREPATRID